MCKHIKSHVGAQSQCDKILSYHPQVQPYPSDPGLEGALSEELEEVDTTEEATEVTDSLRSVEDRM